ncbi:MAG: ABC transporter substrate-binding protein [Acidobacteria bacterium]|nr:MAG: ABC transporter substrate-binding protein [Acidobacteriota bacterium]MCE7960024.1 ABC transporter substrate-binding protein [Acidobacteria bacterium ACB2]
MNVPAAATRTERMPAPGLARSVEETVMPIPPNLPPRTLRVGVLSRLATTRPWEIHDHVSALVLQQAYESPYISPPDGGAPRPLLFSEPLRSEGDPLVVSAAVRAGATFSDGMPCTAGAVATALSRVGDVTSRAEVRARGEKVEFRLRAPDPHLATVLTAPFCGVAAESRGQLLGTGAFLAPEPLDGADPMKSEKLLLRPNPRAARAPALGGVLFEVYPDADALLSAVHAGDVHVTYSLTFAHLARLRGAPVFPKTLDGSSTGILFLNVERPALADPRTRRALCASVSRTEIARVNYGALGLGFAAPGLLPPFLKKDVPLGSVDGNLGEARQILDGAGLKAPERLTLVLTWGPKPYLPDPPAAAKSVADTFRALGTEVTVVQPKDRAEYAGHLERADYDLLLGGWIADTPLPADFLDSLLLSSMVVSKAAPRAAAYNLSRWRDPATDRALAEFRRTLDVKDLTPIVRTVHEQGLMVPLLHGKLIAVSHRDTRRFEPSALARSLFAEVEL